MNLMTRDALFVIGLFFLMAFLAWLTADWLGARIRGS